MKKFALTTLFLVCLICRSQVNTGSAKRIMLPNPRLLGCTSSDCGPLWLGNTQNSSDVYPKRVVINLTSPILRREVYNGLCPLGLMAHYDKSVSMEDLKSAIDERYRKWAVPGLDVAGAKVWKVESERFVIQLSVMDKTTRKSTLDERGTKTLIYLVLLPMQSCRTSN